MRAVLPTPCSPISDQRAAALACDLGRRSPPRADSVCCSRATGSVMNGRDQTRTSRLISGPRSMCSASQRSNVVADRRRQRGPVLLQERRDLVALGGVDVALHPLQVERLARPTRLGLGGMRRGRPRAPRACARAPDRSPRPGPVRARGGRGPRNPTALPPAAARRRAARTRGCRRSARALRARSARPRRGCPARARAAPRPASPRIDARRRRRHVSPKSGSSSSWVRDAAEGPYCSSSAPARS